MLDIHEYYNHLSNQTSPYLLQHVNNPVDWYPWGDEAFQRAREEDKMVFLSVGYSTCHWCHVMAHESFENQEVANLLSKNYISIKVDREERPDIDEVYMNVCQSMTGSGGWPLTIIMTPDKKPFFAGTYFPTHSRNGIIGFIELLNQLSSLWHNEREKLIEQSDYLVEQFSQYETLDNQDTSNEQIIENAYNSLLKRYDSKYGGFSTQPKFPSPHNLFFLLRYYKYSNDLYSLKMAETTLQSMYAGGIFDHVGYGFSRYSTDNKWLVPHFEKMLYDNALLILTYTEAYSITKNEMYRDVVEKIIKYVMDEMTSPEGAFFSALDADSEGIEGKYYVFDYSELKDLLQDEELHFLENHYNVSKNGNFEGKNILNKIGILTQTPDNDKQVIKKLFEYRKKRVPPFLDTKILSSWNGLMIAALSYAGSILNNDFVEYAKKTANFILSNMMDSEYNLYTSYKDNNISNTGFLPDYSNVAWGLINLYSATLETDYLKHAINLTKKMIEKFWDENQLKFFMNEKSKAELPFRPKDEYDGATPSGNSVAVMNLIRLYNYTHNDNFKQIIDSAIQSSATSAENYPNAYMHFISALLMHSTPHRQIVITGKNQKELYNKLIKQFMPFTTVILYDGDKRQVDLMPELRNYPVEDNLKAYICENFTCGNPIDNEDKLFDKLSVI